MVDAPRNVVPLQPDLEAATLDYNFALQRRLERVLKLIEEEKSQELSVRNLTYLTTCDVLKTAKDNKLWTCVKVAGIAVAIAALHPLVLGSIACFSVYRVSDWNDLYSNDTDVAINAIGLYSNLGHSVGYLLEGLEIMAATTGLIVWPSYKRAVCKTIETIYEKQIRNKGLCPKEQDFLFKRKAAELSFYYTLPS